MISYPCTTYLNHDIFLHLKKMTKEDLETRSKKAVLKIEKRITHINNVLNDLSLKLCHIIKSQKDYYSPTRRNDYYK